MLRTNDYLYDVDIRPVLRERRQGGRGGDDPRRLDAPGGRLLRPRRGRQQLQLLAERHQLPGRRQGGHARPDRHHRPHLEPGPLHRSEPARQPRPPLLSYADNSDGGRQRLEVERPFYSLDTRWAAGLRSSRDDRLEQPLLRSARSATAFRHRRTSSEVYGGLSPGWSTAAPTAGRRASPLAGRLLALPSRFLVRASARRWPRPGALPLPPDRTLAYPWISFESIQDRYVIERDLDRIQRSEDLNLGRQSSLLGSASPRRPSAATPSAGSSQTGALRRLAAGPRPAPARPARRLDPLRQRRTPRTWWPEGSVRWYVRDFGDNVFYASLGGDLAHQPGPRGSAPARRRQRPARLPPALPAGDRRVLLTLEQRFFSGREIFHLAHLGAAVFFDAGSAWFVDTRRAASARRQDRKVLKDIGLGLRIGSSRSSRGSMVHLDLAFPLDGDPSIQRVQWLVSTSGYVLGRGRKKGRKGPRDDRDFREPRNKSCPFRPCCLCGPSGPLFF